MGCVGLQSYEHLPLNLHTSVGLNVLDVPECMSSHLTTIHYKGFSEYEMELVEQILKEAKVLKTMKTTVESDLDSKLKLRIHKKIMKFPRASQNCQIAFDQGFFHFYSISLSIVQKQ